jgi:hypothetical protein
MKGPSVLLIRQYILYVPKEKSLGGFLDCPYPQSNKNEVTPRVNLGGFWHRMVQNGTFL